MMQVPRPLKDTVEPETEQTPALDGSVGEDHREPRARRGDNGVGRVVLVDGARGVDVIVIVCEPLATVNDCCTWAAA